MKEDVREAVVHLRMRANAAHFAPGDTVAILFLCDEVTKGEWEPNELGEPRRSVKKYTMIVEVMPPSQTEVAVLLALAAELGNLDELPNFDPTGATVQVSFASGNVGRARLELAVVA